MTNFIFHTDSYKQSHFLQYPPNTMYVNSYIEARRGSEAVVFFGMQAYLMDYLVERVQDMSPSKAKRLCAQHGVPFNNNDWRFLQARISRGEGLPIEIYSVDEGTVMPAGNVQVQIRNTDERYFWLGSWLEMQLLRAIWYPSSVATNSRAIKKILQNFMSLTCDNLDGLDFMLHDFGGRGATCSEAASLGGSAHLINFKGSDTMESIEFLEQYYDVVVDMPCFSVPASEHSTMTAWGKDREVEACENMLDRFPNQIVSVVSDSYDIYKCTSEIWGNKLKDKVNEFGKNGGRLVVRPDSGDLIATPLAVFEILAEAFGCTENREGFRVLPNHIRILQGDGLNLKTLTELCTAIGIEGISLDNFVFGMGGGLLQNVTRDTYGYAMKASAVFEKGRGWYGVNKDPVGGSKLSKKGILCLYKDDEGEYVTALESELPEGCENLLKIRYKDGQLYNKTTFDEVRENAKL